jgi:hypothetical protein
MIAIGNTYITQLIEQDLAGRDIRGQARIFDSTFRSFYDSMLPIYLDQYAIFGDAEVMPLKVIWDYTYYWGVLAPLFFHDRLTDVALLAYAQSDLNACKQLNELVQAYLRQWSQANGEADKRGGEVMFDQCRVDWFADLNHQLTLSKDATQVRAHLHDSVALLRRLAHELIDQNRKLHPDRPSSVSSTMKAALGEPKVEAALLEAL